MDTILRRFVGCNDMEGHKMNLYRTSKDLNPFKTFESYFNAPNAGCNIALTGQLLDIEENEKASFR